MARIKGIRKDNRWDKDVLKDARRFKAAPKAILRPVGGRLSWEPALIVCGSCKEWTKHTYSGTDSRDAVVYACDPCGNMRQWG